MRVALAEEPLGDVVVDRRRPATRHEGLFMGFVPAESVGLWPGGMWNQVAAPVHGAARQGPGE